MRHSRSPLLLTVGISLLLTSCTSPNPGAVSAAISLAPAVSKGSPAAGIVGLQVSGGRLTSSFDPTVDRYELTSLNTLGDIKVRVTTTPGSTASINGVALPSGRWKFLPVTVLDKSAAIPIDIATSTGTHTYKIATLPADFPDYTVTANNPTRGVICFTANPRGGTNSSYVFVTDELGHPLYYKKTPSLAFNLQRFTAPDGTPRYAFLEVEGPQLPDVGTYRGTVRLLDGNFKQLKRISLLPTASHSALPAELHDFVYLNDNDYIVEAYEQKVVSNIPSMPGATSSVLASIIQEVRDGRVVFEWDSTDHPEFYANSQENNDFTDKAQPDADYMHMNAICLDPQDSNLLVSFRNQDQVVKLDRNTGAILWRLGGKDSDFPLTSNQQFSRQHHVRMAADGTITLFDNGNSTQQTFLLSFKLDEGSKQVTAFTSRAPETRFAPTMGSYQTLDADHVFVGWGTHGPGLSDALEITNEGVKTFELTFNNPTYLTYRALKYPD